MERLLRSSKKDQEKNMRLGWLAACLVAVGFCAYMASRQKESADFLDERFCSGV